MNRFLLLMTCVVSLAAAGVLDVRIMNGSNQQGHGVSNQIAQMSQSDLQKQKFILDVLQGIQQQTSKQQIVELGQNLIEDSNRYVGGIDEEMAEVIQLARQQQLLGPNDFYTIRNEEHVRQLRGIYRLLVRSVDWNTLQRNIAYLRLNVNPVLLVNALILAIRDRADTQNLVVPAIEEILPELYIDEDVVRKAQNIDLNMLTNNVDTTRPSLLDLIGLGKRTKVLGLNQVGLLDKSQLWMPWRDIRMQMVSQKLAGKSALLGVRGENKVVLPVQRRVVGDSRLGLLTEDIGMKTFVQQLFDNLLLEEKTTNQQYIGNMQQGRVGSNGNLGIGKGFNSNEWQHQIGTNSRNVNTQSIRNILSQGINEDNYNYDANELLKQARGSIGGGVRLGGQWGSNQVDDLPTTDINSDRLLHVSRRRLNSIEQQQQQHQITQNNREGFMNAIRSGHVSDGRRVVGRNEGNQDQDMETDWMDMITGHVPTTNNKQRQNQNQYQNQMGDTNGVRDLPTTDINDERLVHVNRRRQNQINNNSNNNNNNNEGIWPMRMSSIGEGRHVDWKKERQQQQKNINEQIGQGRIDQSDILEQLLNQQQVGNGNGLNGLNQITQQDVLELVLQKRLEQLSKDDLIELVKAISQNGLTGVENQMQRINGRNGIIGNQHQMDDIEQLLQQQQNLGGISGLYNDDNDIEQILLGGRSRKPRSLSTDSMKTNNNRDIIENLRGGEILMHTLQQLVARINLERISLGQQEIPTNNNMLTSQRLNNPRLLNIDNLDQGYALRLNEMRVDSRRNRNILQQINEIERSLEMIVEQTLQQVTVQRGINNREQQMQVNQIIGDVLIGRLGKVGVLQILRELVQYSDDTVENNKQTLLGIGGVSLNDPVVQHLIRRIVNVVDQQRQQKLGPYKKEDLQMEGVTINDVRVGKLRTFIDESDTDLVNLVNNGHLGGVGTGVGTQQTIQQVPKMVVAREQRLNHKEFNIDLDVTSNRNQRVVIRTLLGPKTDAMGQQLTLNEARQNFIVLNAITTELQTGRNHIKQNSRDIIWTAPDTTPLTQIYQQVMSAIRGQVNMLTNGIDVIGQTSCFPHRLLLPRGRVGGMQMQLLVVITPVESEDIVLQQIVNQQTVKQLNGMGISTVNLDRLPLGFPLDRQIQNELEVVNLSNVQLLDVIVQHEN